MRWRRARTRIGDEVRYHRDHLIADYIASGMPPDEARRRAFLELGNVAAIEEEVRDVRGRWVADVGADLRYALRALRRTPAFAAVAILSLALGIGANSAIFTIVNAVLLRPLPVPAPEQLVQLARLRSDGRPGGSSYPLFVRFRDQVRSISGAFAQWSAEQAVSIDGEDELLQTAAVTGDYFRVLGVGAAAGRLLTGADEVPVPAAAVISDDYWLRRFGRDPSAIGRALRIRGDVYTIVGVAAPTFTGIRPDLRCDVIVPLVMSEPQREPTFNVLVVLARLRPGATVAQANAEVQVLWRAFQQETTRALPEKARADALRARAAALPAADGVNPLRYEFTAPLLILLGLVALVLLLACVNLSGLLLARGAARRQEIAVRLAIGASRARLIRQLLTESLVLAALGGTIGLALSGWLGGRLVSLFSSGNPLVLDVAPDWRVLAFTALVSLAACVLAGLVPAALAVRDGLHAPLKSIRATAPSRAGKILVSAQLAISMILVVGAALFVASLLRLYSVDRGFDGGPVLVAAVRQSGNYTPERLPVVQAALLERLATLPGVRSASAAQVLPLGGGLWNRDVQVEGYTFRGDESESVGFNAIAPGYFATIGTPLVAGREFDGRDAGTAPPVAIVNETFARYFFGDAPALGRRIRSLDVTYTIVGVARDAKYQSLRHGIIKTMYVPWTERREDQPLRYSYLVRLASSDPAGVLASLDRAVRDADPGLRLRSAITYGTLVDRSLVAERLMATLAGSFGGLALGIAALGVFGLLAFHVTRRTNEFGIRMALGASRGAVMRLVLNDVAVMVAAGVAIGGAVALTLTGLARKILFGVTPADPLVFATAAAVLAAVALLAAWLPARRAARVDPLAALRHE